MWSSNYHEATVALQGREEAVAAQAEAIEMNLTLLGATAVEDRLQEGVPQAISTLSAAGIKVRIPVLYIVLPAGDDSSCTTGCKAQDGELYGIRHMPESCVCVCVCVIVHAFGQMQVLTASTPLSALLYQHPWPVGPTLQSVCVLFLE